MILDFSLLPFEGFEGVSGKIVRFRNHFLTILNHLSRFDFACYAGFACHIRTICTSFFLSSLFHYFSWTFFTGHFMFHLIMCIGYFVWPLVLFQWVSISVISWISCIARLYMSFSHHFSSLLNNRIFVYLAKIIKLLFCPWANFFFFIIRMIRRNVLLVFIIAIMFCLHGDFYV